MGSRRKGREDRNMRRMKIQIGIELELVAPE
jgi:hypothetical protein